MEIKNLSQSSLDEIVSCLNRSFIDYFVPLPTDVDFWSTRFENARVDLSKSWGAFDLNKLVGFIINAIDEDRGQMTAFNTGTGILPSYRGKKLVDKMYEYGFAKCTAAGIHRYSLEVITKNDRAIHVYKRIGFRTQHKMHCYKGKMESKEHLQLKAVSVKDVAHYKTDHKYSWDNKWTTILKAKVYDTYLVYREGIEIGYFIINPNTGYVAQLETLHDQWDLLCSGIATICPQIKINNIKEDRSSLLEYMNANLDHTIDQYEMEKLF